MAEDAYYQTVQIYGWSALERPLTLLLGASLVGWIVYSVRTRPVTHIAGPRMANIVVAASLALLLAVIAVASLVTLNGASRVTPLAVAIFACGLCLLVFYKAAMSGDEAPADDVRFILPFGLFLLLIPFIGVLASGGLFIILVLVLIGIKLRVALISSACLLVSLSIMLRAIFDIAVEKEFVGRIAWALMDY
jgi:hypothetical protein